MFGSRRHRPPIPPLTAATADPNAATAAAAVFKRHESNSASSLSAAAAAAALRARPTTPIRVADVQTKRTLRRSASVASSRTPSEPTRDDAPPPTLTRRGSSGSMTERTFRSPSPHRPASSGSMQSRNRSFTDQDMPPVPALPKDVGAASSSVRSGGRAPQPASQQRRATSLTVSTTPMRLASQKLASGDGPAWFGAAKIGDLGSVRRTDPAMASPPSSPLQLLAREDDSFDGARPSSQASSINFSYPTRTRRGSSQTPDLYATAETPADTYQPQASVEDSPAAHPPRAKQQPRGQTAVPSAKRQSTSAASEQALVYDPNSRRMVRQADLLAVEQKVINASLQPTNSKRKKRPPQRAGSHLAAGTMGRTKVDVSHAVPAPAKIQPSPAARQAPLQPNDEPEPPAPTAAASVQQPRAEFEEPAVKAIISSPRIEAKRLEQKRVHNAVDLPRIGAPAVPTPAPTAPAAAKLAIRRQPSVVQEEPESELDEEEEWAERHFADTLDPAPGRQVLHPGVDLDEYRQAALPPQGPSILPATSSESRATVKADQTLQPGSAPVSEGPGAAAAVVGGISRERTHSSSPARQAHFGPVQQNLTVKHSPPPRSVSPRKSAMKHTSSSPTRDASPSGGGGGDNTSEASGGSVSVSQEAAAVPSVARKKSVRVSFDDSSTGVVGEAAPVVVSESGRDSPLTITTSSPSETHRHSWLPSFGRSHNNKDGPLLDEDDETMTPRPALPSFGSVRNRKPREAAPAEQAERPLVRPKAETKYTPPALPAQPLGVSTDHVIGAVLSNGLGKTGEQRGEQAAASTGHGDPLPPVVTSVEGNGYFSDTSDDASSFISSEFERPPVTLPTAAPAAAERRVEAEAQGEPAPSVNNSAEQSTRQILAAQSVKEEEAPTAPPIPAISLTQPTPLSTEDKPSRQYFVDVPGGFPESESDQSSAVTTQNTVQNPATVGLAAAGESRPTEITSQAAQPTRAEDSSDSESSIYSDAYEDLSDVSGDGFQSLDAVVESPVQRNPSQQSPLNQSAHAATGPEPISFEALSLKTPEEAPKLQTELSSATTAVESPPTETPQDEWEKAKAYWKSLTAEKRAQLEREAKEDAGTEADMDDEVKAEPKQTKKKSIERRNSERKALAVHMAQQMMAQQQQQQQQQVQRQETKDPERTYMIKPGSRWDATTVDAAPMRKTMRQTHERQAPVTASEGATLRKSMRTSAPVAGRQDHPPPRTAGVHAAAQRPMSSPAAGPGPAKPAAHRRSATQAELAASAIQPTLTRRGSTGSESSFKRARSARAQGGGGGFGGGSGGGFNFRHSMRPTSPPASAHGSDARSSNNKRFSLRTLSPAGSAITSDTTGQMRTTLRGAAPAARQQKSTSPSGGGGFHMPSFGLSYGGGKKGGSSGGGGGRSKGFASRLADSSDEEKEERAARSAGFRSRFDESSDDEPVMPMPVSLRASSGSATLPHTLRKESSAASTALPEELEEEEEDEEAVQRVGYPAGRTTTTTSPQQLQYQQTLRRTRSGRGTLLPHQTITTIAANPNPNPTTTAAASKEETGDSSPRQQRRTSGGFLSALRRRGTKQKEKDNTNRVARQGVSESAARRDTRLERSVGQLERIRSHDEDDILDEEGEEEVRGVGGEGVEAPASPVSPAKSPRLQKRGSGSGGAGFGKKRGTTLARALSSDGAGAGSVGQGHAVGQQQQETVNNNEDGDVFRDNDVHTPLPPAHFRRASTSGNLGTRTLSNGGSGGGGGGFLHLHLPHRRVSSMGMEAGSPGVGVDGASVAGSVAGGSMAGASSTRKKRFGALRRMFGLDE